MDELSLAVPASIVESLPSDGENAAKDMERAVAGWETRLNRTIDDAESDEEAARVIVDVLERFERRWEQYDDFVAELRAWGQSPIYAMGWRNLQASLLRQIYEHEGLAEHLDRERHARILEDGIRPK